MIDIATLSRIRSASLRSKNSSGRRGPLPRKPTKVPAYSRSIGCGAHMTAFADFPYPLVEAAGENALATWEELKKAGRGAPVVLGDRLEDLLFLCDLKERARQQPIEKIVAAAEAMQFPQDL